MIHYSGAQGALCLDGETTLQNEKNPGDTQFINHISVLYQDIWKHVQNIFMLHVRIHCMY